MYLFKTECKGSGMLRGAWNKLFTAYNYRIEGYISQCFNCFSVLHPRVPSTRKRNLVCWHVSRLGWDKRGLCTLIICSPLGISDCMWRWPLGRLKHVKAEYLDLTSLWKCYLKRMTNLLKWKTNLLVPCSALPTTLHGRLKGAKKCRTPLAGCGAHAGMQDSSAFSPFWPTHPDFRMYDSETMR